MRAGSVERTYRGHENGIALGETRSQIPRNTGRRFSMKARRPST